MTKARSSADFAAGGPQVAGKNAIINGGMDIWQRGTSIVPAGGLAYTSDRWIGRTASGVANLTVSRQATGDATNLPNIQYCARFQRNSSSTDTQTMNLISMVESANVIPFVGKTVTLSFYARAGANYSSSSNILNYTLTTGTGTDQNWAAYTGAAQPILTTATLTTTWQRFTATGTIASNAGEFYLNYYFTPSGTAGAADYFEITGVQLEVGSVATPFSRAGGTIQGELAACQRYYYRLTNAGTSGNYGMGYAYNTTSAGNMLRHPVTMRITPTAIDYSSIELTIIGIANYPITGLGIDAGTSGPDYAMLLATGASGLTTYRPYSLKNASTAAGYIGLSAEL
jgi:hypothetical protein